MSKFILVLFAMVCLNTLLFASFSNNPYAKHNAQKSQKNEKEFIAMLYTNHNIALENKRLKEEQVLAQKKRLREIEKEKIRQAKILRLLNLEEDIKKVTLELEMQRI